MTLLLSLTILVNLLAIAALLRELWRRLKPRSKPLVDTIDILIQINGKHCDNLKVPSGIENKELQAVALQSDKVKTRLEGLTVQKIVIVPKKLVNLVVVDALGRFGGCSHTTQPPKTAIKHPWSGERPSYD